MDEQGKGQAKPARIARTRTRTRKPTEAEEMAAMCAELDRRRAEIEARQVAAEMEDE